MTPLARILQDAPSRIEDRRGEARGTKNEVWKQNLPQRTQDYSGRAALDGSYDKEDNDEMENLMATVCDLVSMAGHSDDYFENSAAAEMVVRDADVNFDDPRAPTDVANPEMCPLPSSRRLRLMHAGRDEVCARRRQFAQ